MSIFARNMAKRPRSLFSSTPSSTAAQLRHAVEVLDGTDISAIVAAKGLGADFADEIAREEGEDSLGAGRAAAAAKLRQKGRRIEIDEDEVRDLLASNEKLARHFIGEDTAERPPPRVRAFGLHFAQGR